MSCDEELPTDQEPGIDALISSFVRQLRNGEQPEIADYQRRHPQLADAIGQLFPPLQMLEGCREQPESVEPKRFGADDLPVDNLGEYQILREIGRGGMGIVYEAKHAKMRRRVALKVLPKNSAEQATNLARFHLEARAAGQLHHTNIVPVFEVGEADGFHFYSMQFIQGENLDLVIDEIRRLRNFRGSEEATRPAEPLPDLDQTVAVRMIGGASPKSHRTNATSEPSEATRQPEADSTSSVFDSSDWSVSGRTRQAYFHRVAALGMQVADALAYAHHNRVLHRDIKPANLILDTDGIVWITDFGLAKWDDDDLTRTGDIVGTLRYMAPERFQGQTDFRCDIYGLGLALYELCTLKNAFESSDRAHLVEQVTRHSPPPPRSIDPNIPRDLETIILKAIDRIPNRRYQTSQSMAEDLQSFLADRPVQARRITAAERLWRVCRRNPVTAALTAASLGLLLAVAIGSAFFSFRLARQADALKLENQRAVEAEMKARRSAYDASLGQAQALRWSRLPGQHYQTVDAVRRATDHLDHLRFDSNDRDAEIVSLRSEAAAALSLADLRKIKQFGDSTNRWYSVAIAAGYDRFAQDNSQGDISIRRVSDGEEEQHLPGSGHRVWMCRFSRDNKYLAALYETSPHSGIVWRVEDGTKLLTLDDIGSGRYGFAPLGRFCLERDGELHIYNVEKGVLVKSIPIAGVDERIVCRSMAVHPAGNTVALGLDVYPNVAVDPDKPTEIPSATPQPVGRLIVADMEDGQLTSLLVEDRVGGTAWVEGGHLAVGYKGGRVELRDPAKPNAAEANFYGHKSRVTDVEVSSDGRTLATTAWDGSVRLWDVETQKQLMRVNGFNLIKSADRRCDDRLVLWQDDSFELWEVRRGSVMRDVPLKSLVNKDYSQAHPLLSGIVVIATSDGVEWWDLARGERLGRIPIDTPTGMTFLDDGRAIITCGPRGVEKWPIDIGPSSPTIGGPMQISVGPPEVVYPVPVGRTEFHESGRLVTLTGTGVATIRDLKSETEHTIKHRRMSDFKFCPDGTLVITKTWKGRGIKVWDAANGELVQDLVPESDSASFAFTPDGRFMVANDGTRRYVWSTDDWQMIHNLQRAVPDGWPGQINAAPDNRTAVLNHSRHRLELFDIIDGKTLVVLEPSEVNPRNAGAFSSDGNFLTTFRTQGMEIWNLAELRAHLTQCRLDWDFPILERPKPKLAIEFEVLMQ